MKVFYQEQSANLDLIPYMKLCVTSLEAIKDDPALLMKSQDVFGHALEEDPVLSSLQTAGGDLDLALVKTLCAAFLEVLHRQLKSYLEDEYSTQQRKDCQAAPAHNMASERILGMSDAQKNRARNANIDFIGK